MSPLWVGLALGAASALAGYLLGRHLERSNAQRRHALWLTQQRRMLNNHHTTENALREQLADLQIALARRTHLPPPDSPELRLKLQPTPDNPEPWVSGMEVLRRFRAEPKSDTPPSSQHTPPPPRPDHCTCLDTVTRDYDHHSPTCPRYPHDP